MRVCVLALTALAFSQPAFARDHAHKPHKAFTRHQAHGVVHHRYVHHRDAGHRARVALRAAPVVSGYAMPQSWGPRSFGTERGDAAVEIRQAAPVAPSVAAVPAIPNARDPYGMESAAPFATTQVRVARERNTSLDAAIARHAAANGLPVELVHRVVKRESGYNPRASSRGNFGLMQIRYQTARGVGYAGSAAGLLDAETNLTYAVKYLAGAYRAAGGNQSRAVALYASGYHGRGIAVARRVPREVVADASVTGWSTLPVAMQPPVVQAAWGSMRDDAMREVTPRRVRVR